MPPKKPAQPAGGSKKTQEKKKEKIIEVSVILNCECTSEESLLNHAEFSAYHRCHIASVA